MSDETFVDLNNARLDEQRAVMEQIIKDDVCPFCPENLAAYHKKPILRSGNHWVLTDNQWPYTHTKNHLLAITKQHIVHIEDLPAGALEELLTHMQWATKERKIDGGGIAMRFGNSRKSGGTVRHLHVQLVEPDLESPDYEPVRIKIGENPK